jgi:pyridoxal phosphate enzyme (YggS family)
VIAEGLKAIRARIDAAATRAGRAPEEIELLAVSKLQPASMLREAFEAGHRAFGENYAQELRDKAVELADLPGLQLHAIGPLQSNKAKYVAQHAASFHALDRLGLAQELSKRCVALGRVLPCFVEVAIAGETQKGGMAPEAVGPFLDAAEQLPGISLRGLMCLPPDLGEPEAARPYFARLRALRDALRPRHPQLTGLSMGMSSDFEVAIAEGATVVRVGSAIFGARPV